MYMCHDFKHASCNLRKHTFRHLHPTKTHPHSLIRDSVVCLKKLCSWTVTSICELFLELSSGTTKVVISVNKVYVCLFATDRKISKYLQTFALSVRLSIMQSIAACRSAKHLGLVVQSIVSWTSSLVVKMLTVLESTISIIHRYFCWKKCDLQKLLTFFQQKY